jgi:hypothetical protein
MTPGDISCSIFPRIFPMITSLPMHEPGEPTVAVTLTAFRQMQLQHTAKAA